MSASAKRRRSTRLTIGDGLVSQIPALLISTSAGIVVTRVASEDEGTHLGREIGQQMLAQPRALGIAAGLLLLFAVIPGLPTVPFLVLAGVIGAIAWRLRSRGAAEQGGGVGEDVGALPDGEGEGAPLSAPSAVALEVGEALMPHVALGGEGSRLLTELVPGLREMLYTELGIVVPGINVRANPQLAARAYRILLSDVPLAEGWIDPEQIVALAPAAQLDEVGVPHSESVRLPGVALPGTLVPAARAAEVVARGIQLVDPPTQMVLHLGQILRDHATELLGIQEAQQLLDRLDRTHPALVQEVVPKLVSVQTFAEILRRLLEESVSIRDLRRILDTLAEWATNERDAVALTERVRIGLRRQICHRHAGDDGRIRALLLDPTIEDAVRDAIQHTSKGSFLALEPQLARDIVDAVRGEIQRHAAGRAYFPLLTRMEIRRYVRRLVEVELPELPVLSFDELAPSASVEAVGRVSVAG
jgi:type III secretion protein V